MIDPKELRIGNLVSRKGEFIRVRDIVYGEESDSLIPGINIVNYMSMMGVKTQYLEHHIDPIPLTPEILERIPSSIEFAENFKLWVNKTDGDIEIEQYGEGREKLIHIKYLHQLQNLYYALTGTELTVEL